MSEICFILLIQCFLKHTHCGRNDSPDSTFSTGSASYVSWYTKMQAHYGKCWMMTEMIRKEIVSSTSFCAFGSGPGMVWLLSRMSALQFGDFHLVMEMQISLAQPGSARHCKSANGKTPIDMSKNSFFFCITYSASYILQLHTIVIEAMALRDEINPVSRLFVNISRTWFGRTEFPEWSELTLLAFRVASYQTNPKKALIADFSDRSRPNWSITMMCLTIKNRWGEGFGERRSNWSFTETETWLDKVGAVSVTVFKRFHSGTHFLEVCVFKPWSQRPDLTKTLFSPFSCGRPLKLVD